MSGVSQTQVTLRWPTTSMSSLRPITGSVHSYRHSCTARAKEGTCEGPRDQIGYFPSPLTSISVILANTVNQDTLEQRLSEQQQRISLIPQADDIDLLDGMTSESVFDLDVAGNSTSLLMPSGLKDLLFIQTLDPPATLSLPDLLRSELCVEVSYVLRC